MATSIADLFVSVTSDVSGALSGLTSLDQKINGTSTAMAAAAPAGYALAGAAGAVGAAFVSSVNVAADFEHQINGIKSVMSPTEVQQFGGAVEDLALKLGKDTTFSASQAAEAIETMIKAGVPLPAILNGAAASALDLASATGTDVTLAAELASNAMNTFHQSAEQLPAIMDTIANISNATATSVQQLKFGLAAVGPVADGLGISFNDTATALGIFANNGLAGSDAGTSLKTMLLNLIPQTGNQVAAFRELGLYTTDTAQGIQILTGILQNAGEKGMAALAKASADGSVNMDELFEAAKRISPTLVDGATNSTKWAQAMGITSDAFFDATGSAKSMSDIFEILKTSTANLTNEQKINLLQTAFGTDAVRAATIASKEGAAGFAEVTAAMDKMGGTQVAAAQRNQGLAGSLNQLGGSFETIQITIGQLFLPVLTQAVTFITGLLNAFLTLDPGIQTAIIAIVGIAGVVAGLVAGFILIGPVIASVGAAFGIIAGAAAAVALPIAALVAAGALLYAAWQDDFGGIREVTAQVFDAIQPAFVNIQNFISALLTTIGPAFSGAASSAAPFIAALSNDLAPILARLPDLVRLIGDGFNALSPILQSVFEIIRLLTTGDFRGGIFGLDEDSGLVVFLLGIHDALALLADALLKLLNGDFAGAWQSLWGAFTTALETVITAIDQLLPTIGGLLVSFLQSLPGLVAQYAPGMWNALLEEFAQLPGILGPAWDAFADWLGGVLGGIPQFVGDMAGDVWAALRTAFEGLVDQIAPAWDAFAGWLGAVVGGIAQFVLDNMGDIFEPLAGAFFGLVDLLAPAWDAFAGWLGAVVGGIGQFVIDSVGDIWGGLTAAFFGLVDQLAPAWDAFASWLGNVLAGLPQFVADHIGDVWGALIAAFTGSAPGTTTTGGGGTSQPPLSGGGVGSGGITGPLVSIGTLVIGSQAESDAFLQQMADAILAATRRVSAPPPGTIPALS